MAGYTIPLLVSGMPEIEAAISAVENMGRKTANLGQAQINASKNIEAAAKKATEALISQANAAESAAAVSMGRDARAPITQQTIDTSKVQAYAELVRKTGDQLRDFDKFRLTKQEREWEAATMSVNRYSEQLAEETAINRIAVNGRNAGTAAMERQIIANQNAVAAMQNFNGELYESTARAKMQTAELKRGVTVSLEREVATARLKNELEYLASAEAKEAAALKQATSLTAKRNALLAQTDPQIKKLTAEIAQLTAKEVQAEVATKGLSHHINMMAQAAAAGRASMYGLGTSFGIYTSSTILVAATMFAVTSAIRAAVVSSMEYQKSLARLGAMSTEASVTGEKYADTLRALNTAAQGMAKTTPFGITESAKAMEQLALAGLNAQQSIAAVGPTLKLASVGGLDAAKAADIMTNVMMGFNLSVKDLPHIADVISMAATQSNSDVEQLGNAMSYAAPLAETFGVSLEYTAGMMEVLANAGIKASRAGTGVRRLLLGIFTPTKQGADAMKNLGVAMGEVSDIGAELESLDKPAKGLVAMADGTSQLASKLKELYLVTAGGTKNIAAVKDVTGIYGLAPALQILKSLDAGEKSVTVAAEKLANSTGYVDQQMAKIQNNVKSTVEKIMAAAGVAGNLAYESQLKMIDEVTKSILGFVSEVANSPAKVAAAVEVVKSFGLVILDTIKYLVAFKLTLMAVALGVSAFTGFTLLVARIKEFQAWLVTSRAAMIAWAGSLTLSYGASNALSASLMAFVKNPYVIAIGLITAALGGLYLWLTKSDSAIAGVQEAFDKLNASGAKDMQRSVAETLEYVNRTLAPLQAEKAELEKILRTNQASNEELNKTRSRYNEVTAEIEKASEALNKMASISLSSSVTALTLELQKATALAKNTPKPAALTGWGRLTADMNVPRSVRDAEDLKWQEVYAAQQVMTKQHVDDLNNSLAVQNLLMAANANTNDDAARQLRVMANTINDIHYDKMVKDLEALGLAKQEAQKHTETEADLALIKALGIQYDNLNGYLQVVTESRKRLDDVMGNNSSIVVTLKEIEAMVAKGEQASADRVHTLTLTEEQRQAKLIAGIRARLVEEEQAAERAKKAWEAVRTRVQEITAGNFTQQQKADALHAANVVGVDYLTASSAAVKSQEELDKAMGKSSKSADSYAKAQEKLIKTAAELYKQNQELIKQYADFTRGWAEFNNELYNMGGAALDEMSSKARVLGETLQLVIKTGSELPGVLSDLPTGDRLANLVATRGGPYQAQINARSAETGVPAELMNRLLAQESSFNPSAVSPAGARGIAQFMPGTAKQYGLSNPMNPVASIDAAFNYMRDLLNEFEGDARLALAAYNAGSKAVRKAGNQVPPYKETQGYVASILGSGSSAAQKSLNLTDQSKSVAVMEQTKAIEGQTAALEKWRASAQSNIDYQSRLTGLIDRERTAWNEVIPAAAEVTRWNNLLADSSQRNVVNMNGAALAQANLSAKMKNFVEAQKEAIASNEREVELGRENSIRVDLTGKQLEDLAKKYDPVTAAMKEYAVTVAWVNRAMAEVDPATGKFILSLEAGSKALEEAGQKARSSVSDYAAFFETLNYGEKELSKIGAGIQTNLRDSLAEAFTTGKMNFEKFLTYLRDAAAKFAADKVIQGLFQPANPATKTGGGLLSGAVSAVGGLLTKGIMSFFASGGTFNSALPHGVYSSPTLFPMTNPGRHAFASGTGLLGEAGPEAVLPLTRASNGKLGVQASGPAPQAELKPPVVNIVVNTRPGDTAKSTQNGNTLTIDIIEQTLASRVSSGGTALSRSIELAYGTRRA